MKRIYQDKFDDEGNCLQACIASLLELELDQVPDFVHDPGNWWLNLVMFLNQHGIHPLDFETENWQGDPPRGAYYLLSGESPRGLLHSVVYLNGKLMHDPHPDGGGIDEPLYITIFLKTFGAELDVPL